MKKSDRQNKKGIRNIQELQKKEPGGEASFSGGRELHGKRMADIPAPDPNQVQDSASLQAQAKPKEHKWGKDPARQASMMSRSLRLLRPGTIGSKAFEKRRKQLRLLVRLVQLAVRLVNAFDKKTVYRK